MLMAPLISFVSVVFGRWLRVTEAQTYPKWNCNISAAQKMSNVFAISAACPASFSKQLDDNDSTARNRGRPGPVGASFRYVACFVPHLRFAGLERIVRHARRLSLQRGFGLA